MAQRKKKSLVRSAALEKTINDAVEKLRSAVAAGEIAVASRARDAKKLAAEGKRLSKKRATLMRRKAAISTRLKKDSSAENRKAAKDVEKELNALRKAAAKNRSNRSANNTELTGLRGGRRRLAAYVKSITGADRVLNRPKKKRQARRRSPADQASA